MMYRNSTRLATALAVATVACQPPPSELTQADRAAIEDVSEQFVQHVQAGDFASLVSLYTEDASFMPPNEPSVTGRADIQAWMEGLPPVTQFSLTTDEIAGEGDLAYVRGRYVMQVEGFPVDSGKYIEIRLRGDDGVWRMAADIFNSSLSMPEM